MEALLEREDELDLLDRVASDAAAGHGRLVLVPGEAGIGKTSLVRALRERLGNRLTFLTAGCEALSVPVPLAPLRELVEMIGLDIEAIDAGDRITLARRLLDSLCERAPVVAVIEDAHWADPSTLDVIRVLARRIEDRPVAIVVTYRDDEAASNPELAQLLGDLATSSLTMRIPLARLSDRALRELAAPAGLDPVRLARLTGGNPFLVVEVLAAADALPASIRDAALARVGRLSESSRELVEAAAVVGQRVEPWLLDAVAPDSANAVEEALARGVLVAEQQGLGFRHELIREAIEAGISPPRRSRLHGRVLAALYSVPERADNARLAHHAELAGMFDAACRHATLAAGEAERLGALRETRLQAERALRLGSGLDPLGRFELLVQYSRASNFASPRLEDAVESADEAVRLAQELRDSVRHGRALVVLAWALWSADRLVEARAAAEQAVDVLEREGDPAALARARSTLVRMEATAFDPGKAVDMGPAALDLAEEVGLEDVVIDVEISIALARGHRGDPGALDALAASALRARTAGLSIQTVRSHVNLVYIATTMREHALVEQREAEAEAMLEEYDATIPRDVVAL